MGKNSVKCQVCNNPTLDPSGYCHLHKDSISTKRQVSAINVSTIPSASVADNVSEESHREWLQNLDPQTRSRADRYFRRNYEGQMVDLLTDEDLESTPVEELRGKFSSVKSTDYTTEDDEAEIVMGLDPDNQDWSDDDWARYDGNMQRLETKSRNAAIDNLINKIEKHRNDKSSVSDIVLERSYRDLWKKRASSLYGASYYHAQLDYSIGDE